MKISSRFMKLFAFFFRTSAQVLFLALVEFSTPENLQSKAPENLLKCFSRVRSLNVFTIGHQYR